MPAAIGAFILGAELAGTAFLGTTLGTFVGSAVLLGGSIVASRALSPSTPASARVGTTPSRSQVSQATVSQAVAPRARYYGRVKVGGVRAFWDVSNGQLFQIIMVNHGEIYHLKEWWLGDQFVATAAYDAGGNVLTEPFYRAGNPAVFLEAHTGAADQARSQTMMDFWPGVWSDNHRLRGIAYFVALFQGVTRDEFTEVFRDSYNLPVRVVIDASRVWDPRNPAQVWNDLSTHQWSENPSLIILDYLLSVDGLRKPLSQIDVGSFIGFADRCAELVDRVSGGPERRYRCWGGYTLAENPKDVLQRMLETCDGELYETGNGTIAIRGGAWAAPIITIGDDDILSFSIERGNGKLAAYNELKPVYTSLNHDFQPQETDPWIDQAVQDDQGRIAEDYPLDMVPSWTQARRLAKIKMARDNPRWRGTIVTDLRGLELLQPQANAWDRAVFTLELSELGIDAPFVVTSFTLRVDLSACEIAVQSYPADAFAWTPAEEEGEEPPPPQDTRPIT